MPETLLTIPQTNYPYPAHVARTMGASPPQFGGGLSLSGIGPPGMPTPGELANLDPGALLQNQHDRQMSTLRQQFSQAEQAARAASQNKLITLQNEYDIEMDLLKRRYQRLPMTAENSRRAWDSVDQLNAKYTRSANRIQGKVRPDMQALQAQWLDAVARLQADHQRNQLELQVLDKLHQEGKLDDDEYLQSSLDLAGVDVPISYLRGPKPASPQERFTHIGRAINAVEDELEHYTRRDPWWGAPRLLYRGYGEAEAQKVTPAEQKRFRQLQDQLSLLQQEKAEILAQQYEQYDPAAARAFRKSFGLSGLSARQRTRRRGEGPGTLTEGILAAKEKATPSLHQIANKKLTPEIAKQFIRRYDGNIERAKTAARREGYTL